MPPDLRALIESSLIDKEDGTIFDINTKLLWQQSPSDKTFTWQEANEYCESLILAGHSEWRLPTKKELEHLINKKYQPTIDPIFKCENRWYWSSSTYIDHPYYAWHIRFHDGYVCGDPKAYDSFVRAVRG